MNFKYNIPYLKKNFNFKNFINDLSKIIDNDYPLIEDIIWYSAFKKIDAKLLFSAEWDKYAQKLVDDFYKVRNKKFRLKIHNYEYDGTLLERINDNFKLEVFYDFSIESHSLIKSKFKNKYFHLFALRDWDNKKNKPVNTIQFHDVIKVYPKKINAIKFFEDIIERDKKENRFMAAGFETYMSPKGINYYELYEKGKLK